MNPQVLLFLSSTLCGLGIGVQSLETLATPALWKKVGERNAFHALVYLRLVLTLLVACTWFVFPNLCAVLSLLLFLNQFVFFGQFGGALTGGSDSLQTLILFEVLFAQAGQFIFPHTTIFTEVSLFFITAQCLLSYFMAGVAKLRHAEWRQGKAMGVFVSHTIYGSSLPSWFQAMLGNGRLMLVLSWGMMLAEVGLPIVVLRFSYLTPLVLALGVLFHLANAYWFGLNRFVYNWLATYPCVLFVAHILH